MDDQEPPSADRLPEAIGGGGASDVGPGKTTDSVARRRRERIREHLDQALSDPDPTSAALGCVTADLLTVSTRLGCAILKDSGRHSIDLDDVDQQLPAVNLLIRTTKQVAQIEQLRIQLRARSDLPRKSPNDAPPSEEI
jgi:hypothetical protein